MSYFFVTTLQVFFCVSLLSGILWSRPPMPSQRAIFWTVSIALLLGIFAGISLPKTQLWQLTLVSVEIILSIFFLLSLLLFPERLRYVWQGLLIMTATRHWMLDPNLRGITSTDVLNTDLLLNLAALLISLALVGLITSLSAILVHSIRKLFWPLAWAASLLIWLPLSGSLLLLLIKRQVIPLSKPLLSYIAHVTNSPELLNWAGSLLMLVMVFFWLPVLRQRFRATSEASDPIAYRILLAERRNAMRLMFTTLGTVLVVAATQRWWDLVASRPLRLSEAKPVTLAEDELVHIPVPQVQDGLLHRFTWVADDGKAIRFFVINRYPDKLRFGVVFDACQLCGDQGYVMEGNQVICVACGVHIFIPSIGKPGGCNPIPVKEWHNNKQELTIPRTALTEGADYFTTVMTINVRDPVDGSPLTNKNAQFRFNYDGKTWFFATEDNYNLFRSTPGKYVLVKKQEKTS